MQYLISGCASMPATANVQTRIDPATRDEAAAVLATMGMTVSQAMRMLLTRIATEKALPFEPLVPNETTIMAMRDARAGIGMRRVNSVAELMAALDDEDETEEDGNRAGSIAGTGTHTASRDRVRQPVQARPQARKKRAA